MIFLRQDVNSFRDSLYFSDRIGILKLKKVDTHARNKGTVVTEVIKLLDKLLLRICEDLDFTLSIPLF